MTIRRSIVLTIVLLSTALLAGLAPQSTRSESGEPAAAQARSLKVDPVHSSAVFRIKHNDVAYFYGRFNDTRGTVRYGEGGDELHIEMTIPAESVDTANGKRDRHLKSPDFFNAREFPEITFKTKESRKVSDGVYEVTGDLTLHGVTKPITAEVEATGCAETDRGYLCGFETTVDLKRTDFDMGYMVGKGLSDEVRMIISLETTG